MLTTTSFYYFKYFLIETHFTSKFRDLNEIKAKFIKRYVTIQSIVTFDLAQSTQNERHGDEDHDGSCFHYLYIIHYHYSEWNRCCRYVGLICLLQTHFARILFQNDLQCSWKSFSKPSRWLIHKCIFMYKCLNDLAPRYVCSNFKYAKDVHNVNTKSSTNHQLAINGHCSIRSFQYQGAIEWNKLPLQIRVISSLQPFKEAVLDHIKGWQLNAFSPWAIVYCYLEFKLRYLENLKLFSIRVKELSEPIVLWRKGDGC